MTGVRLRRMIGRRWVSAAVLALAALAFALPETASAVRLQRIASFAELTHVAAPPNGDRRGVLYMVERRGRIVRYAGGNRREFLDIRGAVSCCVGERGLLSVAFDPAYRTNRFFYVFHTGSSGDLRVSRFAPTRGRRGSCPERGGTSFACVIAPRRTTTEAS